MTTTLVQDEDISEENQVLVGLYASKTQPVHIPGLVVEAFVLAMVVLFEEYNEVVELVKLVVDTVELCVSALIDVEKEVEEVSEESEVNEGELDELIVDDMSGVAKRVIVTWDEVDEACEEPLPSVEVSTDNDGDIEDELTVPVNIGSSARISLRTHCKQLALLLIQPQIRALTSPMESVGIRASCQKSRAQKSVTPHPVVLPAHERTTVMANESEERARQTHVATARNRKRRSLEGQKQRTFLNEAHGYRWAVAGGRPYE